MNATAALHAMGQSLWLDNITRDLLDKGALDRYIAELSVTGLTSNPTIFDRAVGATAAYDQSILQLGRSGLHGEDLFFGLALEDLRRAADALRPIFNRTHGVDGWVSLEVSPLLVNDSTATAREALRLWTAAGRPNLFIKIPGTPAGLAATEESIYAGVPVNVTLLFSTVQYQAAADAYTRGIERRVADRLDPRVGSVASVFVSRWDSAVADRVPRELRMQLGIAVARQTYRAYRDLLATDRWQRLANEGALPQRLLWASTGVKDPSAPDTLYVSALAAPHTVNTMPEGTLLAFAEHGSVGSVLASAGADTGPSLVDFAAAGVEVDALGSQLQREGAEAFVRSWEHLLACIRDRLDTLGAAQEGTR